MKFFIDISSIDEIVMAKELGVIDGVVLSTSVITQVADDKLHEKIKEICSVADMPVCIPVESTHAPGIIKEAVKLVKLDKNIVIQIPVIKEGLKAIHTLSKRGIMSCATLVFSANQALLAAKAGATYVNPFIGRLDDIGHTGINIIRQIIAIYKNYNYQTQIMVSSIRHPEHVISAAISGANIIIISYRMIDRLINHPLTETGLEKMINEWRRRRQ
jgi:transaldolase